MNNWFKVPIQQRLFGDINGKVLNHAKQSIFDRQAFIGNQIAKGVTPAAYEALEREKQALNAAIAVLDVSWCEINSIT